MAAETPAIENDDDLVARVLTRRDQQAFSLLVERHQARLRGVLLHLSRDPALADDLAQNTFLRAWRNLADYKGPRRFGAWLSRIAYREFLMVERRARVERRYTQELRHEAERTIGAPPSSGPPASLDVTRLLDLVEPIDRTLLVLVYAAGLTTTEAAQALGSTPGTVKSRLHRAKAHINAKLKTEQERQERESI